MGAAGLTVPRFELPGTIPDGARNDTLFRYACSLQARGRSDVDIAEAVERANAERCAPPLPASEVAAIVGSATGRYEKGAPLAVLDGGAAAPERLPAMNDRELSRLFASMHRDRLRWVPQHRCWYAHDGARWVGGAEGGEQEAQRLMKGFSESIAIRALQEPEERRANAVKGAMRYAGHRERENLLRDCQSEMVAHASEFDRDRMLFNCTNGTLNLRSMEFRPHDPADMLTKVAGCAYDPQAGHAAWSAFLRETFGGDEGLCGFLQRAIGAALAGDTSEERFYIAKGLTRTGKSTTFETIGAMFGGYHTSVRPETFEDARRGAGAATGDLARLAGARLVVCPEPRKRMRLDASLIKQLTGGDTVTARRLYGDEFDFRPCFQLWFNTNYLPVVDDQTVFESGRAVVVPFENRRPKGERDQGMKERMCEPGFLSGVLNWAVGGLLMRAASSNPVPAACLAETAQYAEESDTIGVFLADRCEVGEGLREAAPRLYESYAEWARANGYGVLNNRGFYSEIECREGIRRAGRGTVGGRQFNTVFEGLRVKGRP